MQILDEEITKFAHQIGKASEEIRKKLSWIKVYLGRLLALQLCGS